MAKKNFVITTVATAPDPATTGTSLVVASGKGALFADDEPAIVFPEGEQPDSSNAEIVMVTNIATDTLTIIREQESTTARTIVVGDIIMQGITAKDWNDLMASGFTWKGAWATSTVYAVNDTVENDGSGYVCTQGHTSGASTEPSVGASWTDYWDLFVEGIGGNGFQIDCSGGTSDTYGVLSGLVNSSNTSYTVSLSKYNSGSLLVYLNGQLQTQGASEDWVESTPSSGTFAFNTAPVTGDIILVKYQYANESTGNADTLDGSHASAFATITGTETLTNKTLTNPTVNFTDKAPDYSVLTRAYRNGEQSNLTTGDVTVVELNAETYDLGADFNTGTYTFTAPVAGYYSITGVITYTNTIADKAYYAKILINDTDTASTITTTALAGFVTASVSDILYLSVNDTVKLAGRQVSGANTVDIYGYSNYTYLTIMLVST